MKATEFQLIRQELLKTQKQMSELLGISLKAVQSFEQGWRIIPPYVERQALFLLASSLSVADDGPGIGRSDRRSIFGRFERGRTEAPGTGRGLYLVEEVARAHGGRVDLATAEGRESTFTLVLPSRPPGSEGKAP